MVKAGELALYFHDNYCVPFFIPKGIHKPHEFVGHIPIWEYYAEIINAAGQNDLTNEEVINAFFQVLSWNWDAEPWPGHPNPIDVVEQILENRS